MASATMEQQVRALFDAYGSCTNDALTGDGDVDTDGVVSAFADFFVGSTPQGVYGGANDARFRDAVRQGFAHYRNVGGRRFTIASVKMTTLNDLHAVAEVCWEFEYVNKQGDHGVIRFTNFYFVTIAGGKPGIFAYVTADEEKAMREHGLA